MATLRQRSGGVWEVRVYAGRDVKGRRIQVSRIVRGSRRTAELAAAAVTVEEPSAGGAHSVAQLLETWQELCRDGWTPATALNQASRARLISAGSLGRRRVGSLKVEDIDRWIIGMRAEGTGRASVHNRLQVLRAALAQAVKWGWINHNPVTTTTATATVPASPKIADQKPGIVVAINPIPLDV